MEKLAEITVKGYGSVGAMPDCIQIDLAVVAIGQDYPSTLGDLNARVSAINAALIRAKTDELAKTKTYGIEEVWSDPYHADKRKFQGYQATQRMCVTIPLDQVLLGRVVGELALSDSKPSISFAFVVRDTEPLKRAARIAAVVKAKETASDLSGTAGLKLVGVKSIDFVGTPIRKGQSLHYGQAQYDTGSNPEATPDFVYIDEVVSMVWEAINLAR